MRKTSLGYERLYAAERLRLAILASVRRDRDESIRLQTSVPVDIYEGPDPGYRDLVKHLEMTLLVFRIVVADAVRAMERATMLVSEAVEARRSAEKLRGRAMAALGDRNRSSEEIFGPLPGPSPSTHLQHVDAAVAVVKGCWSGFERFCRTRLDMEPEDVAPLVMPMEPYDLGPHAATVPCDPAVADEVYGLLCDVWEPGREKYREE